MSHPLDAGGGHRADDAADADDDLAADDRSEFKNAKDRSSKLFDLRFLIGGLFTLYGVMVTGAGLFDSAADLTKSGGVRINLWTGLGMLALGLLFLLWAWRRPLLLGGGSDPADSSDRPPAH